MTPPRPYAFFFAATGYRHRSGVWAIVEVSVEGHDTCSVDLLPAVSSEERRRTARW